MKRSLWILVFLALFIAALGNFLFFDHILNKGLNDAREKLILIASSASHLVDADTLFKIPLRQDADKTPEYKIIFDVLERIKNANPLVKYIYIMAPTEKAGVFRYIVDADLLPEIITAKSPTSFSGDEFDASAVPGMLKAYDGPFADKNFIIDAWGVTLTGYAPIYDYSRKVVAILCVDMDAKPMRGDRGNERVRAAFAILTGAIALFVLGRGFLIKA